MYMDVQVIDKKRPHLFRVRMERVGLVAGMAVASLNIWTGAPLAGLWVGSRLAGEGGIWMPAVAAIVITIFAIAFVLLRLLAVMSNRYDTLSGRRSQVRQHVPWLRPMSGERPHGVPGAEPVSLTALEYVLVAGVIVCFLLFEVWFFFFSTSPIDARSGRS